VVNTLRRLAPTQLCDLTPIDAVQAQNYLLGYRDLERRFFADLLKKHPPRRTLTPDAEAEALGRLVRHHARDPKSLISTPLLMHFATELAEGLEKIRTISDLYDRIVDEALQRDLRPPADGSPAGRVWPGLLSDWEEGVRMTKVVMTRVALAILASDPNATRLSSSTPTTRLSELFCQLVQNPDQPFLQVAWTHPDGFWNQGPYQTENYQLSANRQENKVLNDALLEIGLFRREEQSLGFAHDSLVYYFAGKVALRDYLGPGMPFEGNLSPDWSIKVAQRLRDNPRAWELAGQFLGASLKLREILDLAREMLAVAPKLGTEGLAAVLYRIIRSRRQLGSDNDEDSFEQILAKLEHVTWRGEGRRHPEALASMASEWLRDGHRWFGDADWFINDLSAALEANGRPWASSTPPILRPTGIWHQPHSYVTRLVALDDGRIASGGAEGSVVIWEPASGEACVIHRHRGAVKCLASLEGGGVASGSEDGVVTIWKMQEMESQPIQKHGGAVNCLAQLSGGGVASGGDDGVVAIGPDPKKRRQSVRRRLT
jgi:hypothetical protein